MTAPLVVFAYNRPDHLEQTLSALARAEGAGETSLWLFCDGARTGQSTDRITMVREVARDPRWERAFASVSRHFSEVNKGLARSVIAGVDEVISAHGRVIVIEDDLIVSPDFLSFMNACLEFYENNPRIGSITGFSPLQAPPEGYEHDVMAVPRCSSHGWATWADRWAEIDWEAHRDPALWSDRTVWRRMDAAGTDQMARLWRQLDGRIDSWAVRFCLWQAMTGRLTIYPAQNRVQNIGFDGSGVHTRPGERINTEIGAAPGPAHLVRIEEDARVTAAFRRTNSGPLHRALLRHLRLRYRVWRGV